MNSIVHMTENVGLKERQNTREYMGNLPGLLKKNGRDTLRLGLYGLEGRGSGDRMAKNGVQKRFEI